jgi:hypothetical protein
VLLLENLRFHQAETDNDEAFARALAELAMCMSTMPSERPIGHTPPPKV